MKLYGIIPLFFLAIFLIFERVKMNQEQLKYLGQIPPTLIPAVFAPDFISKNNESEFGSIFNKDATDQLFSITRMGY